MRFCTQWNDTVGSDVATAPSWWNVFRDVEHGSVFVETFLVTSWAEHMRQHERFTQGDRAVEARVRLHLEDELITEHFIQAELEG